MPELQTILTYRVWCMNDGEGQALALREREGVFSPSRESLSLANVSITVARGPVPRDPYDKK